ncbi:MAG: methyltransferase [Sphingobium sp.]|nr:methyltransferase [Sphingobium sp.]
MNTLQLDRAQNIDASEEGEPLLLLLRYLAETEYRFVTVTPASHQRVLARYHGAPGMTRNDVLGWSRPYVPGSIDPTVERLLGDAGAVEAAGDGLQRSAVRVSTVHQRLFLHSAFPTVAEDSVFLGPDSYRFADLINGELAAFPLDPGDVVVDMGTGSGVGAITCAGVAPDTRLFMTDINPRALRFARINADAAGCAITALEGRNLAGLEERVAIAVANPPYVIDPGHRAYRDGGRNHGGEISLEMARAAATALKPGGRFILYTGSAIIDGTDLLREDLSEIAATCGCALRYRELDPDVFGEELELPHYRDVDRIAVVAAIMTRARC